MKIGAIICEFNPLHNGHLYLINKAKKECDILIAIMSGDFNQRGIPSIVSKEIKTKWALEAGFDIVVENNFEYIIQSSDYFASGAIMQAKLLGVTNLYFGSENFQSKDFEHILNLLNEHDQEIKEQINGKTNYPRLVGKLLREHDVLLESPNDILGLSYLKAIKTYDANIKLNPIKRLGGFHSLTPFDEKICSATYLRHCLESGDISNTKPFVPNYVYETLSTNKVINFNHFEGKIMKNIYKSNKEQLKQIFGVDEGLENRILKLLPTPIGLDNLINLVKTKRYTYNRLQRMFLNIGLNIKKDEIDNTKILDNINLLAANKIGNDYISVKKITSKKSKFETKIKRVYNEIITNNKGDINMSFVVEAQIEIQKGSRNKYETLDNGKLKLDRVLPSAQVYPADYGFFNQTLGQDGDPLDVLLLSSESLLPTALVDVRIVGVMFMVDGGEKDEKLIGVVAEDPRFDHVQTLEDVPAHTIEVFRNYFSTYKQMQNKVTEVIGFENAETAQELYNDAVARFNEK